MQVFSAGFVETADFLFEGLDKGFLLPYARTESLDFLEKLLKRSIPHDR